MLFGADFTAYTSDINLPTDALINKQLLSEGDSKCKVYVGLPTWGKKDWVGALYPRGTKENEFLHHYAAHYNAIELVATHYQIPNFELVKSWAAQTTGKEFLFCPKVTQSISHYSQLTNAEELTTTFFESMSNFGEHLGPVFLQMSDLFSPKRIKDLCFYLKTLPGYPQCFLEVRHKDWFNDPPLWKDFTTFLREHKIGLIITDTPGRRDVLHMELTIPSAFIRFVGHGASSADYSRIKQWQERLNEWKKEGLSSVYFFLHMVDASSIVSFSKYAQELLLPLGS